MFISVFVRTSVARGQTCNSDQLDLKWMLLSGTAGEGPERLRVEEKLQEQDPTCVPSSFISPSLPASNCPFLDQHLPRSHERGLRQPQAGTLRPSSQLAREIAAHSGPAFSNAHDSILWCTEVFNFEVKKLFFCSCFCCHYLRIHCQIQDHEDFLLCSIVLALEFSCLVHFELGTVCDVS